MVVCIGGCSLYALVVELSDTKNNKNKIHMALDGRRLMMVHTTTNQKHAGHGRVYIGEDVRLGGSAPRLRNPFGIPRNSAINLILDLLNSGIFIRI